MDTLFIGDTGTQIILDCGINISSATMLHIVCRKPDGTKVTWSGVLEGTNTIKYALLKLSTKAHPVISLDNPEVIATVGRLVYLGLLSSDRAAVILS